MAPKISWRLFTSPATKEKNFTIYAKCLEWLPCAIAQKQISSVKNSVGAIPMKGMMVTLLVWVMTGTVIGQQPNQDNASQLGRFILYLNDQDLRTLQANPEGLSARRVGQCAG